MVARSNKPGRLRIVAGNWRSRLLEVADVPGLRPTSERIRETLFNWLSPHIHGARCLDLCAGTGALGLEALSRGAASAVFVEYSRPAVSTLQTNITALEATGASVVQADARDYLRGVGDESYDIVFLDPPFAADMLDELCRLLLTEGVLAAGARIYLELARDQVLADLPESWQILKDKTAGNVRYLLAAHHGQITKAAQEPNK